MRNYIREIRDFINKPEKHFFIRQDKAKYNRLCSALDTIDDNQSALDAYLNTPFPDDLGVKYLVTYGVLQAIFVQIESVQSLCASLGIADPIDSYPELRDIKEIRNKSIGHPTYRNRDQTSHFISQSTLTYSGYNLMSVDSSGKSIFQKILTHKMIEQHQKSIFAILENIIQELEKQETEYKEKFRMDKLADVFTKNGDSLYWIEKLVNATLSPNNDGYIAIGKIGLDMIQGLFNDFKQALENRGLGVETYIGTEIIYDLVDHILSELALFIDSVEKNQESHIHSKTAHILVISLSRELDSLKQIAEEIDNKFSDNRGN